MELIKCKDLSFAYGDNLIFKNISFDVNSGDFILLLGNVGCGKTTLLKLLKKEIAPKGRLTGSLDIAVNSDKIGFVFQNPDNQIICQIPYEEIAFGMANHNFGTELIKENINKWSDFFGISNLLHRDIMTLSGGEKQLVNLASVMTMNPEILILDEPSSMLDNISSAKLIEALKNLHKVHGTTIILCTHNKEYFKELATKTIEMTPTDTVTELVPLNDYSLESIILSINDVSFKYPESSDLLLKDINIDIKKGSCTVISGPNGSGKSTLFKLILGALKPNHGTIKSQGKIVYMPQNPITLFGKDTVAEDLNYYLKVTKKKSALLDEIMKISDLFSTIPSLYNLNPLDLSGGQLAILSVFKLLLAEGDILLLDEPTKFLDQTGIANMTKLIWDLCKAGKTIIIITHNEKFANLCTKNIYEISK